MSTLDSLRAKGVPVGYIQLDDWWYGAVRLQPPPHTVAASIAYGYSLHHIRLQPRLHTVVASVRCMRLQPSPHAVAASIAYGYSLDYIRL